jgi:hypothetical protein
MSLHHSYTEKTDAVVKIVSQYVKEFGISCDRNWAHG